MMTEEKALWQYVSVLKPKLRSNVHVIKQDYRQERWYLLHDTSNGRFIRINRAAYQVVGRLDGDSTMADILALINENLASGEEEVNPNHVLAVISQLHEAEFLKGAIPLSAQEVLNRYHRNTRFRRLKMLANPLAVKVPLLDPDSLLNKLLPLARLCFSRLGLMFWLLAFAVATTIAGANSSQLFADIANISLGNYALFSLCVLYPSIKILHELGHGLVIKTLGGEVHEAGINFLLFFPVPYVDGSASCAFRDKYKRALVGAAGILVELFIAFCALIVWSLVEPGLIQDMALYCFVIASVSTVLFNANPLLRFDGYYVLEDIIEIPNLSTRARKYYLYLTQYYILGLKEAKSPVTAIGERRWFASYGLIAPIYRLLILFTIASYLISQFFIVGVILATWAMLKQVFIPLYQGICFLLLNEQVAEKRLRAGLMLSLCLLLIAGMLAVPVSLTTQAQGIVWLGDDSRIVAQASGFISPNATTQDREIVKGEVIAILSNEELQTEHRILQSKLRELQTKKVATLEKSRVESRMISDAIKSAKAQLALKDSRVNQLTIRAKTDGFLVVSDEKLRGDSYVKQGDLLAYIVRNKPSVIRAVISQEKIGLLESGAISAQVMFSHQPGHVFNAEIIRQVPAASRTLPSASLGMSGGGEIKQDSNDRSGLTAAEDFFIVDLVLPEQLDTELVMSRAHVRLQHGEESIGLQLFRNLQQLLLHHIVS